MALSEEIKQKISNSMKGREGHKHTEETKQKMVDNKYALGYRHTLETKEKMSAVLKGKGIGENNANWRGGISFEPYCHKFNNKFKESVRAEFGRECFICGTPGNGRKLDVHHVNYDKSCLCSDIKCEFVPLCRSCHMKTNNNREHYENLILEKLEALNWEK